MCENQVIFGIRFSPKRAIFYRNISFTILTYLHLQRIRSSCTNRIGCSQWILNLLSSFLFGNLDQTTSMLEFFTAKRKECGSWSKSSQRISGSSFRSSRMSEFLRQRLRERVFIQEEMMILKLTKRKRQELIPLNQCHVGPALFCYLGIDTLRR